MSIKLDSKQQEQIVQNLKLQEVPEELLNTVAGGIIKGPLRPFPITTMAIGEEGSPPWIIA